MNSLSAAKCFGTVYVLALCFVGPFVLRAIGQNSPAAVVQTDSVSQEDARTAYETILAAHPNDVAAQSGEVQVSEGLALKARATGDRDSALAILLRAQTFAPESTRLLYDLGVLEDEMHLYHDADKTLSRAEELGANDLNLLYAAGRVKLDLGQLNAAEEKMIAYLRQKPEDASAHYAMGRIYHQGLRFVEAIAEFQRSIELQPRQTESYYQLGETQLEQGDYAQAIKNFSITLQRDPKHAGALVGTGMAYFKQKQYSLAAEPLQKAVAIEPEYQPGHYYLGLTLDRLGNKQESTKELSEAARLAKIDSSKSMQQLRIITPPDAATLH